MPAAAPVGASVPTANATAITVAPAPKEELPHHQEDQQEKEHNSHNPHNRFAEKVLDIPKMRREKICWS